MTTSTIDSAALRAGTAPVSDGAPIVAPADGRRLLSAPLAWYPRLLHGSPAERASLELSGGGEGVHWPDSDEDLSVESIPAGRRSGQSLSSFQRWLSVRPANS